MGDVISGIISAAGLQIGFIVILFLADRLESSEPQIETPPQEEAPRSNRLRLVARSRGGRRSTEASRLVSSGSQSAPIFPQVGAIATKRR